MGLVALVKSFIHTLRKEANVSDVQIDTGGGAVVTAEHFADSGDDSFPLITDYCAGVSSTRQGNILNVGYLDPLNTPKSILGDKRIYARDPATGACVGEIWLHNDGAIDIVNASGFIKLLVNGTVNMNGATIDATGAIVSPVSISAPSVIANGKELAEHTHPAGTPPGATGVNN